jgi:hypothetical protein
MGAGGAGAGAACGAGAAEDNHLQVEGGGLELEVERLLELGARRRRAVVGERRLDDLVRLVVHAVEAV